MTERRNSRVVFFGGGAALFVGGFFLGQFGQFSSPSTAAESSQQDKANRPSGDSMPVTDAPSTPVNGSGVDRLPVLLEPEQRQMVNQTSDKPTMLDAFTILRDALTAPVQGTADEDYLKKYAGVSPEELRIAEFALSVQLTSETKKVGAKLIAAGKYDSQIVGEGERPPAPMGPPGSNAISMGFEVRPLGDGRSEVRTSVIDPQEYPQIGQMQNEFRWLGTYLRHNLGIR